MAVIVVALTTDLASLAALLGGSSVSYITGPAGAGDNHVVVFDGITGLLAKDVGINALTITQRGNAFNGANQLLVLDFAGRLPSLDAGNLFNVPQNTFYSYVNFSVAGGVVTINSGRGILNVTPVSPGVFRIVFAFSYPDAFFAASGICSRVGGVSPLVMNGNAIDSSTYEIQCVVPNTLIANDPDQVSLIFNH
jgi:hypothetical protein